MLYALELAKKGIGRTSPNPPVGAVLVKDGHIIGEGYHHKAGLPHAEIVAIADAKARGFDIENAEIYITLEPCCHHGKTPPCTEAIIENKIARVIYAVDDPNPLVAGKSKKILRDAGIEVITGICESEARWILAPFFKCIDAQRAFVALKFASTLDGRIATKTGDSKWISSDESRDFVHGLRDKFDAIAIGTGTLAADNPKLTVRRVEGRNPIRIVIAGSKKTSPKAELFNDNAAKTIVASIYENPFENENIPANIEIWTFKTHKNGISIEELARKAFHYGISSILLEGGSKIITSALDENVVDRIYLALAPIFIGEGLNAIGDLGITQVKDSIEIDIQETKYFGSDIFVIGTPIYRRQKNENKR